MRVLHREFVKDLADIAGDPLGVRAARRRCRRCVRRQDAHCAHSPESLPRAPALCCEQPPCSARPRAYSIRFGDGPPAVRGVVRMRMSAGRAVNGIGIPRFQPLQQAHRAAVRNAPGDAGLVERLWRGQFNTFRSATSSTLAKGVPSLIGMLCAEKPRRSSSAINLDGDPRSAMRGAANARHGAVDPSLIAKPRGCPHRRCAGAVDRRVQRIAHVAARPPLQIDVVSTSRSRQGAGSSAVHCPRRRIAAQAADPTDAWPGNVLRPRCRTKVDGVAGSRGHSPASCLHGAHGRQETHEQTPARSRCPHPAAALANQAAFDEAKPDRVPAAANASELAGLSVRRSCALMQPTPRVVRRDRTLPPKASARSRLAGCRHGMRASSGGSVRRRRPASVRAALPSCSRRMSPACSRRSGARARCPHCLRAVETTAPNSPATAPSRCSTGPRNGLRARSAGACRALASDFLQHPLRARSRPQKARGPRKEKVVAMLRQV